MSGQEREALRAEFEAARVSKDVGRASAEEQAIKQLTRGKR